MKYELMYQINRGSFINKKNGKIYNYIILIFEEVLEEVFYGQKLH